MRSRSASARACRRGMVPPAALAATTSFLDVDDDIPPQHPPPSHRSRFLASVLAGAVATTAAPDMAQALSSLTIAESPTDMKDVAMKDGKIDIGAMLGNLGGDDEDSPFKAMKPKAAPAPAAKPAKPKAAPKAATLPSDDEAPSVPKFEAPKFDFKMPAMPDIKVPDMPAAPAAPAAPKVEMPKIEMPKVEAPKVGGRTTIELWTTKRARPDPEPEPQPH